MTTRSRRRPAAAAKKLVIQVRSMKMAELARVKEVTGVSLVTTIWKGEDLLGALDEKMIAALLWVVRQRTEPDLTFEEVFASLELSAFGSEFVIELGIANPPPPAAS